MCSTGAVQAGVGAFANDDRALGIGVTSWSGLAGMALVIPVYVIAALRAFDIAGNEYYWDERLVQVGEMPRTCCRLHRIKRVVVRGRLCLGPIEPDGLRPGDRGIL